MNSAVMPLPGKYSIRRVSREEWAEMAIQAIHSGCWKSSVGYQQNADIIRELTGYAIPLDFSPTILEPGDFMLVMRLPYQAGGYRKGEVVPPGDFEFYVATYTATYTATGAQATGPTFGEALRAYLAVTGTTQTELGRRIGSAQGYISRYVSGASSPSAGRIEEIASALGCEIARAGGEWKFTELPNFII